MQASPDHQISLTDPDSRSMATNGRGSGVVGYNVQVAVETEHHLILAHEVTNTGTDRAQLANMAEQAKAVLQTDTLEAVAFPPPLPGLKRWRSKAFLSYSGTVRTGFGPAKFVFTRPRPVSDIGDEHRASSISNSEQMRRHRNIVRHGHVHLGRFHAHDGRPSFRRHSVIQAVGRASRRRRHRRLVDRRQPTGEQARYRPCGSVEIGVTVKLQAHGRSPTVVRGNGAEAPIDRPPLNIDQTATMPVRPTPKGRELSVNPR